MSSEKYQAFLSIPGVHTRNRNEETITIRDGYTVHYNHSEVLGDHLYVAITAKNSSLCIVINDDSIIIDCEESYHVIGIENDIYYVESDWKGQIQRGIEAGIFVSAELVPRNLPACFRTYSEIYKVVLTNSLSWDYKVPKQIAKYFTIPRVVTDL